MSSKTPRCCFIINPKSSGGRTQKKWETFSSELAQILPFPFDFKYTESRGDGSTKTAEALKEGFDVIVAFGGDGTNNEVVNGFFDDQQQRIHPEASFCFYNSGSGGDLRRTLLPPSNVLDFAQLLQKGKVQSIDLGLVTFQNHQGNQQQQYFINASSVGLSGVICQNVDKSTKRWGGSATFLSATLQAFLQYKEPHVSVQVEENEPTTYQIQTIALGNGRFFGGGMKIAPNAKINDGWLDLVVIQKATLFQSLFSTHKMYLGTLNQESFVVEEKARKVTLESKEKVLIEIDGETPGVLPATFQVLPLSFPVLSLHPLS